MGVSCDFRFAAEGVTFWLPEVQNLASMPTSGGISRLTRIVGPHWTRWTAMASERVDADQALAIGLVHAVYPAGEFAERVQAFARKLAGMPREALGVAKVAIDTADTVDRATARVFDRFSQTLLFTSDEFKDRVNSFNHASAAREAQRHSLDGQSGS
jgi:enoyl-CoA hydratase